MSIIGRRVTTQFYLLTINKIITLDPTIIKMIINKEKVKVTMKVKCPKCGSIAILENNFSRVRCSNCMLDVTYGEYVKILAYTDPRYRDILNDYKL